MYSNLELPSTTEVILCALNYCII